MIVEVAYALAEKQSLISLRVEEGTTLKDAIEASGILEKYNEIDLSKQQVGIFSKLATLDTVLREKDRVEIYRSLIADPKEVRKERALSLRTSFGSAIRDRYISTLSFSLRTVSKVANLEKIPTCCFDKSISLYFSRMPEASIASLSVVPSSTLRLIRLCFSARAYATSTIINITHCLRISKVKLALINCSTSDCSNYSMMCLL